MIPFRTQVKLFLENPKSVDVSIASGVFQRWIQQKALEGLLIDVADYRHVFEGPGVVLIGHENDYALENRDGRLGLLFTRKHGNDADLRAHLSASFRLALAAARLLEAEPAFTPRLRFRADDIEIRFVDRLQFPNQPESFEPVKDDLQAALAELYGSEPFTVAPVQQDSRLLFTVAVHAPGASGVSALLTPLQTSQPGV